MYLLFDIGGTKTRVAVSKDLRSLARVVIFKTPKSFSKSIAALKNTAMKLNEDKKFKAVAGALAGSFDRKKDKIIGGGSNIKEWVGRSVKKRLEKVFRAPVWLENDAALAGLAETIRGAGKKREIVVYITVSTGLGGARIVNGMIDENARGFEPSYQIINSGGGLCKKCQGKHLGAHLSGRGISEHFKKPPEKITSPKIQGELAWWLALMLNNTVVYWSPDIIVLGGSVMNIIPLNKVKRYLGKIYKGRLKPPDLRRAKLGDLGGLWGALELLKQKSKIKR